MKNGKHIITLDIFDYPNYQWGLLDIKKSYKNIFCDRFNDFIKYVDVRSEKIKAINSKLIYSPLGINILS